MARVQDPPVVPGYESEPASPDAGQQVGADEIARRNDELQMAAEKYDQEQRHLEVARRHWKNQRERAHLNLMAQLPKLIGAACVGVLLAYVFPLGGDR